MRKGSSRRQENLSSTVEQHGANELRTVARITEFAGTHVRGYRVVVAEVVAVERAPSPSPPSHGGGPGRGWASKTEKGSPPLPDPLPRPRGRGRKMSRALNTYPT